MKRFILISIGLFLVQSVLAQVKVDSISVNNLDTVKIFNSSENQDINRLLPIQDTYIFSGKKNEVIELTKKNVGLAEKYARQIFAKIPGVFVYDMDGTGNQMNIATRGLDPHRGWEFNNRKDGIITNSDMYGYPASHYNIPMEAVEKIELVRGTASLHYGAQFGGMLNYVSKQPDSLKQFSVESNNTVGSYGLVSNFNSISGKIGKFRFMAWNNKKWIDGYRDKSDSKYNAEAISLFYDVSKNLQLKLEWTHSNYTTHLPGALTDAMFNENPKMATRSRNYYNPNIHVPSFTVDWKLDSKTKIKYSTSAVLGSRNSVLFDKPTNIEDAIDPITLQYANRQVDIDHFNSYTSEFRLLHSYNFYGNESAFTSGIQYMNNDLHRQQQGKGTTGTDFDLTLVTQGWGRDLHFKTENLALFAENRWVLSKVFSVNTGARIEIGETNMSGTTTYYSDSELQNNIKHSFQLFGVSAQYDISKVTNIYAGWSQAYRPVIFKDIIPTSVYEKSDKNLKDAYGYNAEIGFRGKYKFLKWDITGFYLQYNNRLGTLAETNENNEQIIFKTNIGDSRTIGLELFLQNDFLLGKKSSLSYFTSTAIMNANYQNAIVRSGNQNVAIAGNRVESVPTLISRTGITYTRTTISFSVLCSYTSASYADALNTKNPSATGAVGIVPSYQLVDLNFSIKVSNSVKFQGNASNILDKSYFTKRPQFYPGPGIWPSDGRTFSVSVLIKI